MSEELRKHVLEISNIASFPGLDLENDQIRVSIVSQDSFILETLARLYAYDSVNDKYIHLTKLDAQGYYTNIDKFGGTEVTGRDIGLDLAKLQNLTLTLTQLAALINGSENNDFTTLQSVVSKEDSGATVSIASEEDISLGVTADLQNFKLFTLYLTVTAACDITVELSPDGGTTWFEEPDSPHIYVGAGDDFINLPYAANAIKVSSTTADNVTAKGRGVL